MSDAHLRLLRRVARGWRVRTQAHRAAGHEDGSPGAARHQDAERSSALAEARLAAAESRRVREPSGQDESHRPPPSLAELEALASHADQRVALQRRRSYLGKGDPRKLAELERVAAGAHARLKPARADRADDA